MKSKVGIVICFMLIVSIAFCNDLFYYADQIEVYDVTRGENVIGQPQSVYLGPDEMVSKPPAMLFSDKGKASLLIPVTMLEAANAKVTMDAAQGTAIVEKESIKMSFMAGKSYYLLNGKKVNFTAGQSVRALSYDDSIKVFVPLDLVVQKLSLNMKRNALERIVTLQLKEQSISKAYYRTYNRFKEFRFKVSGEVKWSSYYFDGSQLKKNDKLVLELYNVKNGMNNPLISSLKGALIKQNHPNILEARLFQDGSKNNIRFEVTLKKQTGYYTSFDKATGEVVLQFVNNVRSVNTESIYGAQTVVIDTGEAPIYNVKYLKDRLIIDVIDAYMTYDGGSNGELTVEKGNVKSIHYSQFEGGEEYEKGDKVSRVVVNLKSGLSSDEILVEDVDNRIYVYVAGTAISGYNYVKKDTYMSEFSMELGQSSKVTYKYDASKRMLTMTVPKTIGKLEANEKILGDNIVDSIKIDTTDKKVYTIFVSLAPGANYTALSGVQTDAIVLRMTNEKLTTLAKTSNTIVVIDPGHGGRDPGAIGSVLGLKEKYVNLETALKLKQKLESKGIMVYMTRENDEYVALADRTSMANDIGASLLLSIHANAYTNKTIRGTEVLYKPEEMRNNYGFAKAIRTPLIKWLGSNDRGLIQRPNLYVLRETKMPSVLVELGYLTHKEEEALLSDSGYQEKAASGLAEGILDFISTLGK